MCDIQLNNGIMDPQGGYCWLGKKLKHTRKCGFNLQLNIIIALQINN